VGSQGCGCCHCDCRLWREKTIGVRSDSAVPVAHASEMVLALSAEQVNNLSQPPSKVDGHALPVLCCFADLSTSIDTYPLFVLFDTRAASPNLSRRSRNTTFLVSWHIGSNFLIRASVLQSSCTQILHVESSGAVSFSHIVCWEVVVRLRMP
jgi:hypothetical protein